MTTPNLDIDALERRLLEPVPLDHAITKELMADAVAALRAERAKVAKARRVIRFIAEHPESKEPERDEFGEIVGGSSYGVGYALAMVQSHARAFLNKTGDA